MSLELEKTGNLSIEATFALRSFTNLRNFEFHFCLHEIVGEGEGHMSSTDLYKVSHLL